MEQTARILSLVDRPLSALIGTSAAIQGLRRTIRLVAASDRPVLVTGPTGAGKELAVRAIHELGASSKEPLFDVNCGTFPESLVEAQLFGHERGAFTGAEESRVGYFEAVGTGTLFLDEIGELSPVLQSKLLRVLEERRFRPVGSLEDRRFCGRVVAATHVDLKERVAAGRFREDLYHRLDVLQVRVPSLEERGEDIPQLVESFAMRQPRRLVFDSEALAMLSRRRWPGNVRELKNLIDRVAVMFDGEVVTAAELARIDPASADVRDPVAVGLDRIAEMVLEMQLDATFGGSRLDAIERALVSVAVKSCNGNKTAAARRLGVHRKVVERQVGKHGL